MKKVWSWKLASWALVILIIFTFLPACFETTQNVSADGASLFLGLPFVFYSILTTSANTFAIHLNIAALLADVFLFYILLFAFKGLQDT